ncbi:AraC family transcriptional regulator [Desulfonema ishimotonii]|uniref:AraC family transcriptional regulator n=1 Tax=Desulfonema ishimotonii TaxID=45657 RepID=A0A401FYQ3_9BACT|nr:AraC family transcriptional regulator [Desulfonema ishimotonii]
MAFADYPPPIYDVGKQNASVERVCNFIRKHYSENLSLGELSKIACLSPFHFQRVFTKEIGISPHNYLMHYRIGKARKKLLKTGYIAETATETGFADQSHFSKKFKQIVGINPGRYLKISL